MDENIQVRLVDSVIYSREPEAFLTVAKEYQSIMMKYHCAIKEIVTKVEILNDELKVRYDRSPIEFIKSRVKSPESILDKIKRKGMEPGIQSIQNMNDIAGVRIICSFIDDIYKVAEMLTKQDDVFVISEKDYIRNPKDSGYRSYHLVVEVPVFLSEQKQMMRVEIQIRTIAMDFWASLEHKLRYKKNIPNEAELTSRLFSCAEIISRTDMEMQQIRKEIYSEQLNEH